MELNTRAASDSRSSSAGNTDPEWWQEEEEDDEESNGGTPGQVESICLADVNPYILCPICGGYFIDATTITECLHTFCKSCIVKHFDYSNRCPKCNITVHQTQPLYNIRLDRKLQDIVYKLVPNLESSEKIRLHEFYHERGLEVPKPVVQVPISGKGSRIRPLGKKLPLSVTPPAEPTPQLDISLVLEFIGRCKRNMSGCRRRRQSDTWKSLSERSWNWTPCIRWTSPVGTRSSSTTTPCGTFDGVSPTAASGTDYLFCTTGSCDPRSDGGCSPAVVEPELLAPPPDVTRW
ncbi:polycomb group RING finger protein 6 isoform X2 [Leucoraja erinacea]|uniref:polycomb group RING finger protein 6 isoform X2 n=1 Tax=Leucoraja erinaceus TaxID=7782 RepID=UPI002455BEA5|nr:polycomb group RING finger protein 6 isoform X2 [Leucoraja erinacea]